MAFCCAVLYLFFVFHFGYLTEGSLVKPKILNIEPEDEAIINAGDNYTLTCQGSKPLKWNHPIAMDAKSSWTSFSVNPSQIPHNKDFTYRSVLYITNMSYPFVGYYVCMYEDGGTNKDDVERDQIYLYVNDTEHLSVEDDYLIHYAYQFQETTIPCRPTAPDIDVKLINYGSEEIANTSYSPKTGFTFTVNDLSFEDLYYCSFKRQKEYELSIYLKVNPSRAFLATPYIEDQLNNHTDVGDTLTLKCYLMEESEWIRFEWFTPRGNFTSEEENNKFLKLTKKETINGKKYLISEFEINNATLRDAGSYTCLVADKQNHRSSSEVFIMVHGTDTCYVEIREENDKNSIEIEAGEDAQWSLLVTAHPVPNLLWFDNKDHQIKNDSQYYTNFTLGKAVFIIKNATLENDGTYRVRGISSRSHLTKNCPKQYDYKLVLNIVDKPSVTVNAKEIYMYNETAEIKCVATGYPIPQIEWEYKECLEDECPFKRVDGVREQRQKKFELTSTLIVNSLHEGAVRCSAYNGLGDDKSTVQYYISDVNDGFAIYNFGDEAIVKRSKFRTEVTVAVGDILKFTCAVSPKKADIVELFHGDKLIRNSERYTLDTAPDDMSTKTTVSLQKANVSDGGIYSCRIKNLYHKYEYKNVTFRVKDPEPANIVHTNLDKDVEIDYPEMPYELFCNYSGIPKPSVEWYKDNDRVQSSERIKLEDDNRILKFSKTQVSDEGTYRCEISNRMATVHKEAALKFKVKPVSVAVYYYVTGSIGLLLFIALVYILVKKKKERELMRELKLLGLENFHNGNPENLNPELGIDDQAELLPYNKKWEFPIEQLKLGKQLGSGAFGVVMKAEAKGIVEGEERTTVAVKMVKKNADQTYIKALASELKIMVHLGKHINVVNLLGACTKNVAKRELLVIVEFCRFGNLQNYLFKHRDSFINQVDPNSGKIDYGIGADILERSYSVSSECGQNAGTPRSMQDYREKDHTMPTSVATQMTSMGQGEEHVTLSNNSVQPEWRSNYRGDYKGSVKPVSTRDLVAWSFQVSRGMEYLASRKVLHGDLAARNILLADGNVAKICDFGLAKSMYNDNNYKKKGNSPLPVKWMAIESIRDRVFSTQSDVWSFGIVLWEMFSLGRTPYPGMEADERLYYKLVDGYRMESPTYAPRVIYDMMLDCWHSKPLARPSFTKLTEKIGFLLEDSVRKHYIDLNDPYLMMNTQKLEENDYLAMLTPPSFDILSTPPPHYVNEGVLASPQNPGGSKSPGPGPGPDGYLFMGSSTIFSPRLLEEDVFDFHTGKRKPNDGSRKENQELRPMLNSNNESDNETGYLTPVTPNNSVSNPIYHLPPSVTSKKSPTTVENELLKTADNYISMPQYKNIANGNVKGANDSSLVQIDAEGNGGNVHYVNGDRRVWNSIEV